MTTTATVDVTTVADEETTTADVTTVEVTTQPFVGLHLVTEPSRVREGN